MTAETLVRVLYLGTPMQNKLRHMTFKGVNIFFGEEPVKCGDGQERLALISAEIPFKDAKLITDRSQSYAIVVKDKVKDKFFNDTGDTVASLLPKLYDDAAREQSENTRAVMSEASAIIRDAQERAAQILADAEAEASEKLATAEQKAAPSEEQTQPKTPARGKK